MFYKREIIVLKVKLCIFRMSVLKEKKRLGFQILPQNGAGQGEAFCKTEKITQVMV